jgi:hypothetical protein
MQKRSSWTNKITASRTLILALLFLALTLPITIISSITPQQTRQSAQTDANYPATDGQILWDAGWETGDTSQWSLHTGGSWGDSSAEVVTSPVRWGKYAGKLTLNPGSGNVRAEITSSHENTGGNPGEEWYYSTSVYFPSNPDKNQAWSDWNDFTQWMDDRANCSPPLQYNIMSNNTITFHYELTTQSSGNCGYGTLPTKDFPIGPMVYDQWIDLTAHIKWSEDPNVGFVQVWRNGQEVVPMTHLQTLDSGSTGVYMEQAMYRPDPTSQSIVYIDGTRRHTAYAAGSTTNPSTTVPTPTPPFATPSFVCGGSSNSVCPSNNPTPTSAGSNPSNGPQPSTQPSESISLIPSSLSIVPSQPCQSNQSVTAMQEVARHHKKHKSGNSSNGLSSQLLALLLQLINMLIQLLGGTPISTPPSQTPC